MRILTILLVCLAFAPAAFGAEPGVSVDEEPNAVDEDSVVLDTPDLIATSTAILPGLLVHGSGHFVAGDSTTAGKLALAQLSGMFLAVGGVAVLAVTGADPRFTPPAALSTMYGVGLFGGSFLADIYGVATPDGGLGDPVTRPAWLSYRGGYRYVDSPVFEFRRHGATAGASYRRGRFGLDLDAVAIVTSAELEGGADLRYRLTGPRPDRRGDDASYSDMVVGYDYRAFRRGDFETHTVDLYLDNRWDLRNFATSLDGSFVVFGAGLAFQTIAYDDLPNIFTTLLLSRMGFGTDLGTATDGWGSLLLYYDHRHDGAAGGFKISGLGSGNAGHFGLRWEQHIFGGWGAFAGAEVGSAWVLNAGVERRFGGER